MKEVIGNSQLGNIEVNRTYRIEHLPDLTVIENLDYPEKKDRDEIMKVLRDNQLSKDFTWFDLLLKIKDLEDNGTQRFFVKSKYMLKEGVDFILGRTKADTINSNAGKDFDTKSRYALAGVMSEIILSKNIKEIVASNEVQEIAKRHGFRGMKFFEPIFGLISKENKTKSLIYQNLKSKIEPSEPHLQRLSENLREIFFKNGIYPHDLRANQFLMTEENGQSYIYLIDTEAYTEITPPTPEQGPKILSFEEFSNRSTGTPHYENFFLFFLDYYADRDKEYYKRFESKHPEMASSLCTKMKDQVQNAPDRSEALKPLDRDLYEAYKIMRGYGVSDIDLFD